MLVFDYLFELFDEANKVIKFVIISFIFLVTTFLIILLFISYENSEELNQGNYHGTTGRMEVSTTKRKTTIKKETTTTTKEKDSNENIPTTIKPTTIVKKTTTTSTSGKKTTTTSESKTTRTTTKITTTKVKDREVAEDSTTYPNALDFWEWNIVDLINAERVSLGNPQLKVAVDLRRLAEQAADYWYDHTAEEVQAYIGDYRFYARQIVNANMTASYNYIYDLVEYYTDITTNKNYEYIGVGVIYLDQSLKGMRTHYCVIIFE